MPKIVVTIRTDSSAFDEDPGTEIARILHETAERYETEGMDVDGKLYDINGNAVGSVTTFVKAST